MALEDYSKYFMYGGIILVVVVTAAFYFLEKQDKTDVSGIKIFLASDRWQGEIINTKLQAWRQLNARYGNDYFYDIDFFLPNDQKLYTAKSLIAPSQMHMLKKGQDIKVKKGERGKMAVIEIDFNS